MARKIVIPRAENVRYLDGPKPGWKWRLVSKLVMAPALVAAIWIIVSLPKSRGMGLRGGLELYAGIMVLILIVVVISLTSDFLYWLMGPPPIAGEFIISKKGVEVKTKFRSRRYRWKAFKKVEVQEDRIRLRTNFGGIVDLSSSWLLEHRHYHQLFAMMEENDLEFSRRTRFGDE